MNYSGLKEDKRLIEVYKKVSKKTTMKLKLNLLTSKFQTSIFWVDQHCISMIEIL